MSADSTQEIPEILYHYTTMEGLKGIIENGVLWASDAFFLNDASELNYALDIFREAIDGIPHAPPKNALMPDPYSDFIEEFKTDIAYWQDDIKKPQIFVASLTGKGDLLSQWRGYCPKGGVSIGFDKKELSKIISSDNDSINVDLSKCEYRRDIQIAKTRPIIDGLFQQFPGPVAQAKEVTGPYMRYAAQSFLGIFNAAPTFKNPAFLEEDEWRLISGTQAEDRFKFRTNGSGYLIPYIEIKIRDNEGNLPIKKIIIAPSAHQNLAELSVKRFIEAANIPCTVQKSYAPYRAL